MTSAGPETSSLAFWVTQMGSETPPMAFDITPTESKNFKWCSVTLLNCRLGVTTAGSETSPVASVVTTAESDTSPLQWWIQMGLKPLKLCLGWLNQCVRPIQCRLSRLL